MTYDMDIVKKIFSKVCFYEDKLDRFTIYAKYTKGDGSKWLSNIDTEDFKAFLRAEYRAWDQSDVSIPVDGIIQRIRDDSLHYREYPKIEVFHRIAGDLTSGIEYFLADDSQNVIHVSKEGFGVTTRPVNKFMTTQSNQPQEMPVKGNSNIFELLQPFVNMIGDSFKLFVIWLIQAFCNGHHFCLFISAERGSGKSLLTHIINKLIDPSPAETCSIPKTVDNLETYLANHYLVSVDNVTEISKEFSDKFCVAITGGTVPRRKKYSDQEMVYLQLHNVIVLNGIGIAPYEPDLAERSLYFPMKKLNESELRPERELWALFDKYRGQILWCVFDILSKAMQKSGKPVVDPPTRMVDAYGDMLAIAEVLGISADEFNRMLKGNIASMHKACTALPLIQAIDEFMTARGNRKLEGTVTDVYEAIKAGYSGDKKSLPPNAAEFGKKLNQHEATLRAAGYRFLSDDTGAKANKLTIIRSKQN